MSGESVKSEVKTPVPMWANVITGLLVLGALSMCVGGDDEPKGFGHIDALTMCQMALQSAAKDPGNADIPYVENLGKGDEYYYAWGAQTKMARMRNGLGLDVAASASCIVDGKSKRITSLTLNGQSII